MQHTGSSCGAWDFSSPTRDRTQVPCTGSRILTTAWPGKVKVKVAQLCPTLCNPMDLVREILQARRPFPSLGDLPKPGIEHRSPTLQADFLPTEPQGKPGWLGKSPKFLRTENYNQSSVQLLSHVQLFATPWTTACQASLSIANSQNLPKLMSTESVMPSNYLILCRPLPLLPSIFASIRIFSN